MCYAARTKGTAALNAVVMAAAESLGVRDELTARWTSEDPEQPVRLRECRARRGTESLAVG